MTERSLLMDRNVLKSRLFPTCQVRVIRFYVSCLLLLPRPPLLLLSSSSSLLSISCSNLPHAQNILNYPCRRPPPAQLRLAIHSFRCRTSTTTIHAQCPLPDLNHDHPRPVFPAGPQPRPSTPSVPCRTSTATIHAQCSLPNLNRNHLRPVFPAGPQPRPSTTSGPCRTSTTTIYYTCHAKYIFYRCHRFWKCCENLMFFSFLIRCIILYVCDVIRHLNLLGVRTPGVLYIPTSEWRYNPSLRESLALTFKRLKVSMSMVLLLLDNRLGFPRSPKPCRFFVYHLQHRLSVLTMKICLHYFFGLFCSPRH